MPITITPPPPANVFTPGASVHWRTDFIGPIETGSTVVIDFWADSTGELPFWENTVNAQSGSGFVIILQHDEANHPSLVANMPAAGADMKATATLFDPRGNVLDSGQTTAPWNPTDGLGVQNFVESQSPASGLTPIEQQQLADAATQTVATGIATDGTRVSFPVGDLVVTPPLHLFHIEPNQFLLTGQGTRAVPLTLPFISGIGIQLDAVVIPPGFGRTIGYVDSYQQRLGQFLALQPEEGTFESMFVESFDMHLQHVTWVFRFRLTPQIAYFITPGVEVLGRWITFFAV